MAYFKYSVTVMLILFAAMFLGIMLLKDINIAFNGLAVVGIAMLL